jgi:hypothetical protein
VSGEKDFNPTYVLYDLILSKPIGYYGITEVDQLDRDVEKYLAEHPTYYPGDLSIAFDKWGQTIPEINKAPDWI